MPREEREARQAGKHGRAHGSERTGKIVSENGYPPDAMRAFCIAWWLMWAAITVVFALG